MLPIHVHVCLSSSGVQRVQLMDDDNVRPFLHRQHRQPRGQRLCRDVALPDRVPDSRPVESELNVIGSSWTTAEVEDAIPHVDALG